MSASPTSLPPLLPNPAPWRCSALDSRSYYSVVAAWRDGKPSRYATTNYEDILKTDRVRSGAPSIKASINLRGSDGMREDLVRACRAGHRCRRAALADAKASRHRAQVVGIAGRPRRITGADISAWRHRFAWKATRRPTGARL